MAYKRMSKQEILVRASRNHIDNNPGTLRYRAVLEAREGQGKKAAKELYRRARIIEASTYAERCAAVEKDSKQKAKARKAKALSVVQETAHG